MEGSERSRAIADRGQTMTCRSLVSLSAVGSKTELKWSGLTANFFLH